ncbi:MAG: hypothetical protein ACXVZ3_10520 [Gaiellaceae bacterium]
MRKFTASILAVGALAGGAFSGAALAAPSHHTGKAVETRSADRNGTASRDRTQHHDTSRDRAQQERETR